MKLETICRTALICLVILNVSCRPSSAKPHPAPLLGKAEGVNTTAANPLLGKEDGLPYIESVYAAAPDVIAIQIHEGYVAPAHLEPYKKLPGDNVKNGPEHSWVLERNGKEIGYLIPYDKRSTLLTYEKLKGAALDNDGVTDPNRYTISSADDPRYRNTAHPLVISRKSKPTDWCLDGKLFEMRHIVYLKMAQPIVSGSTYTIAAQLKVQNTQYRFHFVPQDVLSESVHVSQIGYRPDDRPKTAFVSLWMGTGGGYQFHKGMSFSVVDLSTGKAVYKGIAGEEWPVDRAEELARTDNFNKTGVWRMDFSNLTAPGHYKVVVDGIGCSYPFDIDRDAWLRAFKTQMRGLLNERSGVELGPPYTPFKKPRDFHPADGALVYQSTYSILDGGNEQQELEKHSAGKTVPEAWGGYHDAGDWNPRRITHMRVTMAQLEIAQLFPKFFEKVSWNVPETSKAPDILNEALFELDLFRRLQTPDGGIRYGIETNGDPYNGEVSWLQSMPAYVYAPDLWSSYIYAQVAGRMAKLLVPYDKEKSKLYRETALKAMLWAELEWKKKHGSLGEHHWEITDDRNYAAIVLYDLTGDKHWRDVFLENSCLKDVNPNVFVWADHVQCDAAFAYTLLPDKLADPALKKKAVKALGEVADLVVGVAGKNAWNIACTPYRPQFIGFYSEAMGGPFLLRAYHLSGNSKYLECAIAGCQFQGGCNPNNMTYTSGLGGNPVRHPLHLDSRHTGQPAPEGLTVYGNIDFIKWNDDVQIWPMKWYLGKSCVPSAYEWPITEAYFDIFLYPMINEFTVDNWAPNVYTWGYLAARS